MGAGEQKKPQHIAVIMDGNGRWAQARRLPRSKGHEQGAKAVRNFIEAAYNQDIPYVTLYSFSMENWARPESEINDLMALLRRYLKSETADLHKKNVRLKVIGQRDLLPHDIQELIEKFEKLTQNNDKMTVIFALSYGGRQELVEACKSIARQVEAGELPASDITDENFSKALMTKDIPDPDLLIRSSGEMRISNFLLWQCAYTEFYFSETLWPDFNQENFQDALNSYAARQRRFGEVTAAPAGTEQI